MYIAIKLSALHFADCVKYKNRKAISQSCCSCLTVSSEGCNSLEPVCDSNNIQHSSLCTFITTQGEINYFGYCQVTIATVLHEDSVILDLICPRPC